MPAPEQAITRQRVYETLEQTGRPSGLWVATRGSRVVGGLYAADLPGRVAVVNSPGLEVTEPPIVAAELLVAAIDDLSQRGFVLAQSLLTSADAAQAEWLANAGFERLAELVYLVADEDVFPAAPPMSPLRFLPFEPGSESRLIATIERTYESTLDCPQLNGVRAPEDVLASYRASGRYDPNRWFLVRDAQRDVGCLLLTEHGDDGPWEIVYMGLEPQGRGRGHGAAILEYAKWLVRAAERKQLVAAVDAANSPALRAYHRAGFAEWDRRIAWGKLLAHQRR